LLSRMKNHQNNQLHLNATLKMVSDDESKIFIEGLANTPSKDRQHDVIPSSAWADTTLKDFIDKNAMMLWMHDSKQPIGQWSEAKATDEGLYVKGWIYKSWEHSQKVVDGVVKTLSVHFNTDWDNWEYNSNMDAFVAKKIDDLFEISIVSVPADSNAIFSVSKSLGDDFNKFKKSHQKNTTMTIKESLLSLKSFFIKAKDGDLTDNEKAELKSLLNDKDVQPIVKGMLEEVEEEVVEETTEEVEETTEETTEEVVEETEAEKSAKEIETLKADNAALKAKVDKKGAKPVDTKKGNDPAISANGSGLTEREKQMQESADALKNNGQRSYN
jgi:Escherichia/Staphylococcus phage prohead protease